MPKIDRITKNGELKRSQQIPKIRQRNEKRCIDFINYCHFLPPKPGNTIPIIATVIPIEATVIITGGTADEI